MNIGEFKAWVDGFSAAIDGAPTADQWATIRAKLDTVSAVVFPAMPTPRFGQDVGRIYAGTVAGVAQ